MPNDVVITVKATDNASATIDRVTGKASGLGSIMGTAVKAGALAGAAAVVGFGVKSVMAAADFEHAVDQIGAVANATEKEMKGLSDKALQIGKDTMFGATEAAGAMEILAANGVSAADIMGGAADAAVALGAAGGTGLRTAADVASTSMTVWGLKTSEMTDVVNRLAGAANVSRFGVEDMAQAVAQGGGAAKTAGVEFGDFATSIAAIAPSFSSGSDAGTSFKTFLVGLTGSSDKAKDAMKDLGLITADGANQFFDAAGNMKSMAEVTDLLHNATAGLSEQQKIEAFQTIFGADAMRAAAAVSALTGAEFAKMSDTMKNTDAAAVAAQRMGNFKGSLEELKGSIETLMIPIGLKLMPILTDLSNWLAVAIPAASAKAGPIIEDMFAAMATGYNIAKPLLELLMRNPDVIYAMVAAWAAFKAVQLASMFIGMVTSITSWTVAVQIARIEALLFQAAIGGLVVAAAYFALPAVIDGIKSSFFGANNEAENFAAGLDSVSGRADLLSHIGLRNLTADLRNTRLAIEEVGFGTGELETSLGGMVQGLVDGGATIEQVLKAVKDAGVENVPAVTKVIDGMRKSINDSVRDEAEMEREYLRGLKVIAAAAGEEMPKISTAVGAVGLTWLNTQTEIDTAVTAIIGSADEMQKDVIESIMEISPPLAEETDKWLESLRKTNEAYINYQGNLTEVLGDVEARFPEHFVALRGILVNQSPEMIAEWKRLGDENVGAFDEALGGMAERTTINVEAARIAAEMSTDEFKRTMHALGYEALRGLAAGFDEGQTIAYSGLAGIVGYIPQYIRDQWQEHSPSRVFAEIGSDAIEGLIAGLESQKPNLEDTLGNLVSGNVDRGDALLLLKLGFTDLAEAVALYEAGLISLNDLHATLLPVLQDALPSALSGLKAGFASAWADLELEDTVGSAGAKIIAALNKAITDGTPSSAATVGELTAAMMWELTEAGLAGASKWGISLTAALAEAIRTGTPEAIQAVIDLMAGMQGAMTVAHAEMDLTMENWKDAFMGAVTDSKLLDAVGSAGVRLMGALDEALTKGGQANIDRLAGLAQGMMGTMADKLPAGMATHLGDQLMAALADAIAGRGPEAIAALTAILGQIDDLLNPASGAGVGAGNVGTLRLGPVPLGEQLQSILNGGELNTVAAGLGLPIGGATNLAIRDVIARLNALAASSGVASVMSSLARGAYLNPENAGALMEKLRAHGLAFASGGVVPGPIGQPQLAVVHGGERISPTGGANISITVNAIDAQSFRTLMPQLVYELRQELSRSF